MTEVAHPALALHGRRFEAVAWHMAPHLASGDRLVYGGKFYLVMQPLWPSVRDQPGAATVTLMVPFIGENEQAFPDLAHCTQDDLERLEVSPD